LLTITMPDPPVNINRTRAGAAVLHLFHAAVCCSGDSATQRIAAAALTARHAARVSRARDRTGL
ncbi:MAG: hypothetical protein WA858_09525, partial [Xanthobacteraceae bacterium]